MADPALNDLLRWGIENSDASRHNTSQPPRSDLNPDVLRALLGGPSDADRMKEAMAAILDPEVDLESKVTAFDNFEQLIEGIDNANNMEPLGMWPHLVSLLKHEESELRRMAAWCVGTAVQNNNKAQQLMFSQGAIPRLVDLAVEDQDHPVRKKALYALSSGTRNFEPGLLQMIDCLPKSHQISGTVDASDMEAMDNIFQQLREKAAPKE